MTIGLTDKIAPLGDFAIVEDLYVEGGYRSVEDTTARDAIPAGLRKAGMLVWVRTGVGGATLYQLEADLSTWTVFSGGGFTAGGDLSGTPTDQTVVGIQGNAVAATAPGDGEVLTWNDGESQWEPSAGGGFTAGGDLSGTPTVQNVIGVQGRAISGLGAHNTYLRTRNATATPIVDPNGIAWDGTYLWLGSSSSGTVYKIDPTDWVAPVLTLDLSTYGITEIGFIRVWGDYLLVGSGGLGPGDGTFAVVDWTTDAVVGLGDNGEGASAGGSIVVGDTHDQIWMTGNLSAKVWYFSLTAVLAAFPGADGGTAIATGLTTQTQGIVLGSDGNIWVGCGGLGNGAYLLEINPVAHTITDTRPDAAQPGLIMLWSAFGSIWATQGGDSLNILRYDIDTFPSAPTAIALTGSGSFPYFWDIVADGTYVYVPDDGDYGSVYVIDPDTDAQIGTITNGSSSVWCGPITGTGTSFWVSIQDTGSQGIAEITYTPNVFGSTHAGFTGGLFLDWSAVSGAFSAGGDLSGTSINQQVIGLQGHPFTNTGVVGQVPVLVADPITFSDPTGIVWDDTRGFLWISFNSPLVFKVDPDDWTLPVATIDLTPYNAPTAVSRIRIWENYLLCATGGGDVNLIDLTTDTVVGWGSTGSSGGTVVAGDSYDQVWIDGPSGGAYYFDLAGLLAAFLSNPGVPYVPATYVGGTDPIVDLVVGFDANIWYTTGSDTIALIDPGAHTLEGVHTETGKVHVSLFGAFGSLWAAQGSSSPDILRYDATLLPDPLELTTSITITAGTVNTPQVFVSDGTELWVGDSSVVCNLYEIDPTGNTYEGVQNDPDSNSVHALTWNPTDGIMWLGVGYGTGTTKGYVDWTWSGGGTFGTIHTGFNLVDLLWGDAPGVQWWFNNTGDDPVNPRFNDLWLQPDTGNILCYESYGGGTWTSRATVLVSITISPLTSDLDGGGCAIYNFNNGHTTSDVSLATNDPTDILPITLSGLTPSRVFMGTVGFRVDMYASDLSCSGSIDCVVCIQVTTDGGGAATCVIQQTPVPEVSHLPDGLAGATATLAASVGGFTISATRPTGIACSAGAAWWTQGWKDIGAAP